MKKLETTKAREEFADTVNRVAYGGDRILLRRRGKDMAVLVPVDDLELLERCEEEEAARKAASSKSAARKPKRRTRAA